MLPVLNAHQAFDAAIKSFYSVSLARTQRQAD
jgi:hypothetical protein